MPFAQYGGMPVMIPCRIQADVGSVPLVSVTSDPRFSRRSILYFSDRPWASLTSVEPHHQTRAYCRRSSPVCSGAMHEARYPRDPTFTLAEALPASTMPAGSKEPPVAAPLKTNCR